MDKYLKQEGSDYTIYAKVIKQQVNGAYQVIRLVVYGDGSISKVAKDSTRFWNPIPMAISPDQIPAKYLAKINA